MLIARDSHGARRVAAGAQAGEQFFCPSCHTELVVRTSTRIVPHFAHRPGQRCGAAELKAARRRAAADRRRELAAIRRAQTALVTGQQTLFA